MNQHLRSTFINKCNVKTQRVIPKYLAIEWINMVT